MTVSSHAKIARVRASNLELGGPRDRTSSLDAKTCACIKPWPFSICTGCLRTITGPLRNTLPAYCQRACSASETQGRLCTVLVFRGVSTLAESTNARQLFFYRHLEHTPRTVGRFDYRHAFGLANHITDDCCLASQRMRTQGDEQFFCLGFR